MLEYQPMIKDYKNGNKADFRKQLAKLNPGQVIELIETWGEIVQPADHKTVFEIIKKSQEIINQ